MQLPSAAPLYQRLREAIQFQISDGTLRPGEVLPPERSLQESLGLSRSTIRQAIKSLVDNGLIKSVVGSGNFVLEQKPPTTENRLVSVVTPDANFHVYYADLASSASFQLRQAGFRVDMSLHNSSLEVMDRISSSLVSQGACALIWASSGLDESKIREMVNNLRNREIVVVMIARYYQDLRIDYVGVDNEGIGYQATHHLLELGHRQIIYFGGPYATSGLDRARGYVNAMQAAGYQPAIFVPPGEPRYPDCELCGLLLDIEKDDLWHRVSRGEITGAVCFNDQIAGWVQREIRNLNLVIPHDLSLVGVDNLPYAEFFDAPLTTFALPGADIGCRAAELVLRRLTGETFPPQRILLPAHFTQRRSTSAPRHLNLR